MYYFIFSVFIMIYFSLSGLIFDVYLDQRSHTFKN